MGHLVMGVEMLRDRVERTTDLTGESFPPELLLRLKHMIVSHHGAYEFGSPKLPMTLEAVALHYLDNLDAKIHTFSREIREDPSRDSSWTPFQQSLGRRLYKGTPGAEFIGSDPGRRLNFGDDRRRGSVLRRIVGAYQSFRQLLPHNQLAVLVTYSHAANWAVTNPETGRYRWRLDRMRGLASATDCSIIATALAAREGKAARSGPHPARSGARALAVEPAFLVASGYRDAWKQWGRSCETRRLRPRVSRALRTARSPYDNGGLPMGFTRPERAAGTGHRAGK